MSRGAIGFGYALCGIFSVFGALAIRDGEIGVCIGSYTLSLMLWIVASVFHREDSP